jgi:hypothetical protein
MESNSSQERATDVINGYEGGYGIVASALTREGNSTPDKGSAGPLPQEIPTDVLG